MVIDSTLTLWFITVIQGMRPIPDQYIKTTVYFVYTYIIIKGWYAVYVPEVLLYYASTMCVTGRHQL